jgi:hypothetical protein
MVVKGMVKWLKELGAMGGKIEEQMSHKPKLNLRKVLNTKGLRLKITISWAICGFEK